MRQPCVRTNLIARLTYSVQPVGAEGLALGEVAGAKGLQEGVEAGSVVGMPQVAEFVEYHIVPKVVREAHEVEVQVDIAFAGAAAPVRGIVLDANGINCE